MIRWALPLTTRRRGVDALGGQHVELLEQHGRVHDDAVADDRRDVVVEDPARHELEGEGLAVDDDAVAGVVATLVAHDHVHLAGEVIGELALPLVAPLGPDHHGCGHASLRSLGRFGLRTSVPLPEMGVRNWRGGSDRLPGARVILGPGVRLASPASRDGLGVGELRTEAGRCSSGTAYVDGRHCVGERRARRRARGRLGAAGGTPAGATAPALSVTPTNLVFAETTLGDFTGHGVHRDEQQRHDGRDQRVRASPVRTPTTSVHSRGPTARPDAADNIDLGAGSSCTVLRGLQPGRAGRALRHADPGGHGQLGRRRRGLRCREHRLLPGRHRRRGRLRRATPNFFGDASTLDAEQADRGHRPDR